MQPRYHSSQQHWILANNSTYYIQRTDQTEGQVREGDIQGGIDRIDQALDLASEKAHPPSAFLWCQRGELNKQAGNTAEAISDYEQCIN